MAYANAQVDPRAKLGSILVVGGLHVAVGMGLIAALGVSVVIGPPEDDVIGFNVPVDPPPPPSDPIEQPRDPIVQQSNPTAPDPVFDLTQNQPIEVDLALDNPIPDVGPIAMPTGAPIFVPPSPAPTFNPTKPVPRNGPQGWISTDDYPRRDLNRGNEGTARYTVSINANGRVEQCSVITSTGHSGLDQATCRYISSRARFEPALNAQQRPVGGTYTGAVTWQIPD